MAESRRQTTIPGPASTTDAAPGAAAGGLFTSLATPSGHARTPRASRAVVAAASSLPRPRLPTTTALSPASTAAATTRTRTTATPRPSAAPPPTSQLVRTPGNLRTQKRLARDAPWRPSLIGGNSDAAHKLAERRELVRGPVNAALEELLMVGRDEGGEDSGEWEVGDDARNAVQAFQALKSAYLSPQEFLDASSLQHVVPHEIVNPNSPTNTLIRLSNLTTFLNLVLTSAPDEEGVADRAAVAKLKTAGDALLRHVKPEETPVDEQVIKLIVDIKCQTFLLASSLSRTPVASAPFFSQTLGQLLPPSRANALTDRSAAARFLTLQSRALDQIHETGSDWVALRTRWRWEDLARDARDWVERCVTQSGLGVGPGAGAGSGVSAGGSTPSSSQLGQDVGVEQEVHYEEEDGTASPPRAQNKGKARAPETDEYDGESAREGEAGSRAGESLDEEGAARGEDFESGGEGGTDGDELFEDADQIGSLDVDTDFSNDRGGHHGALAVSIHSSSPSSSSSDADEVARALVASTSPTGARSSTRSGPSPSGPQAVDGTGPVAIVQETISQSDLVMRTDSLFALGTLGNPENDLIETTVVQESLAITNPESDRADDLLDLLGESQPDIDEDASVEESVSAAPSVQQDVESDSMVSEPARRPEQQQQQQQEPAGHIRFDSGNRLVRDPAPKPSRPAFLERQPDARKINFDDSQSQEASPAPRSSAAQQHAESPEAARGARRRDRTASVSSDEREERFSPVPGPSRSAAAAAQGVEMEPYLEQEFGGGYDDVDDADLSPAEGANPLFRRAPSDDDRSTAAFAIDDDLPPARQASSIGKRSKGLGRDDKGKGESRGAVVDREDPALPRPSLQARLAAYPPSQQASRTSHDDAEPSRSSKSQRRSPPRASASKPPPTQLSSDDDSPSGSSDSESDDSVDIVVPSKYDKGKKRAVEPVTDGDDESDDSSPPPRKKSHSQHASRRRSPSPPLPLGAAGNTYFQGRNLPGARVPWSTAETDLLIKLLGQVGCDWGRMMKLHGPNGKRTKTFMYRTNVALKDKAVNLKMGFMRQGRPVPACLQTVTMPKSKMPKVQAERGPANETDEESDDED
ncbi:hypothetical protein JCM9279_002566 [Rhodotorula babjevae]